MTWLLSVLIHRVPEINRPNFESVPVHLLPQLNDGSSVLPSVLLGSIGKQTRDLFASAPGSSVRDRRSDEEFGDIGREEGEDAGEVLNVFSDCWKRIERGWREERRRTRLSSARTEDGCRKKRGEDSRTS